MKISMMKMPWHLVAILICLADTALPIALSRTIDEIISDATNSGPHYLDTPTDNDGKVFSPRALDTPTDDDGSVLVELDMKFTQEQWRAIEDSRKQSQGGRLPRKAISDLTKRWTRHIIPYTIQDGFSDDDRSAIRSAMDEWQRHTCLRFRPRTNEVNYVSFVDGDGCSSFVGMIGGAQNLTLDPRCRRKMVVAHELGHVLGFHHEQSRPDRDDFVIIIEDNMKEGTLRNFHIEQAINAHGIPYDYGSLMHYGQYYFTKNGLPTIVTKDPAWQSRIGQQERLSVRDIELANIIYNCDE